MSASCTHAHPVCDDVNVHVTLLFNIQNLGSKLQLGSFQAFIFAVNLTKMHLKEKSYLEMVFDIP